MKKMFNVVKIYPLTFNISIKQDFEFKWAWIKKSPIAKKNSRKVSKRFTASNFTDIKKLTHVFPSKAEATKDDFQTEICLLALHKGKLKVAGRVTFNVFFFADTEEGQFRQKFFLTDCPDKGAFVMFGIDVKLVSESETLSVDNSISSISDTLKNLSNLSMLSADSGIEETRFQPLIEITPLKNMALRKGQKFVDDFKLSPISKSIERSDRKPRSEPDSPVMDVSASFGSRKNFQLLDPKTHNETLHNFSFGHLKNLPLTKTDSVDPNAADDLDFEMSVSYKPLKEGQDENKYAGEIKKLKNQLKEMNDVKKENASLKAQLNSDAVKLKKSEEALEKARKEADMLKLQKRIRESMDHTDTELYKLQNKVLDLQEQNEGLETEVILLEKRFEGRA